MLQYINKEREMKWILVAKEKYIFRRRYYDSNFMERATSRKGEEKV
jgi:hypothetical protein